MVSTVAAVARWFRVDVRTVHNWKNNGMPGAAGKWNLQDISEWRAARDETSRGPAAATDIKQEEYLDKRASRQTRQARLAKFIGSLVETSIVLAFLAQFAAIVRSRLQAIPGELAASIHPELRHDLMLELENKINLILTEMASWTLPESLRSMKTTTKLSGGKKPPASKKSGKPPSKSSPRGRSRRG